LAVLSAIGQVTMEVVVIELNRARNNCVVSRAAAVS